MQLSICKTDKDTYWVLLSSHNGFTFKSIISTFPYQWAEPSGEMYFDGNSFSHRFCISRFLKWEYWDLNSAFLNGTFGLNAFWRSKEKKHASDETTVLITGTTLDRGP